MDTHKDRRAHGQTDAQTGGRTDARTDGRTDRRMDGRKEGRTDRRTTDGHTDGPTNRRRDFRLHCEALPLLLCTKNLTLDCQRPWRAVQRVSDGVKKSAPEAGKRVGKSGQATGKRGASGSKNGQAAKQGCNNVWVFYTRAGKHRPASFPFINSRRRNNLPLLPLAHPPPRDF